MNAGRRASRAEGESAPLVLIVDDEEEVRTSLGKILERNGLRTVTAEGGEEALRILEDRRPAVILLDVLMPGMDGFQVCRRIQEREELRNVPIVFVTVLESPEDRARAFAAGAADFLAKPPEASELIEKVREHVDIGRRWDSLPAGPEDTDWLHPSSFLAFKEAVRRSVDIPPEAKDAFDALPASQLGDMSRILAVSPRELAQHMGEFLDVPVATGVDPERVEPGLLPTAFCRANGVVPIRTDDGRTGAILANPFDWQLMDDLQSNLWRNSSPAIEVAEPEVIRSFFDYRDQSAEEGEEERHEVEVLEGEAEVDADQDPEEGRGREIMALANELLRLAVSDRASDIHVEPKETDALIRFRIDGHLQDARQVPAQQARMLISRFKALGGLDIAERRKPQDGALAATIHGRRFKLRLATTATPHGESLVIRLVEPLAQPRSLEELGMSRPQADALRDMADRSHGLVLVVGPTGSGKSTTIFSLLSGIDGARRSVVTIEDPVEYRIPQANQQQINEKAGVGFQSLLRSAVRQDPDVLLIGEIRDLDSAKAALDLSSSGHLCVTSLHSSNSTTAVFRLERLGIQRGAMADALLGIVSQQLLRKLCDRCRQVREIRPDERELLERFTTDIPERVGAPVGCPRCQDTGYYGRVGVYEVLEVDPELRRMIRSGAAVADLRAFVQERGNVLVSDHALEKVREQVCSVEDVQEQVLREEAERTSGPDRERASATSTGGSDRAEADPDGSDSGQPAADPDQVTILVVEDDAEQRTLLDRFLGGEGFEIVLAEDGTDALLRLGSQPFDLVLSDINMPTLDGLKLLEIMEQKGVDVPVIFLTARTEQETEIRGLELGAVDYLRKPVEKQLLILRVRRALGLTGPTATS